MKQQKLLAAILCAVAPMSYAANDTLDEIVVTATRIAQPLKQSLSSTTVITRQDIQNSQAADAAAILHSVAGVEISQTGGIGKTTSLFLRGSESTQVLVLLDGVRINSATMGTTSIQDLMLDQIDRIEVVRGNVSSVYGSEAIGGVVQIFTRRGHGVPALNVSGSLGSLGTQRVSVGFGGAVENDDFNIQISKLKTDGVSAINPALNHNANPDKDGYDNTSLSANIRHMFNADHSLSATIFNSQGHNQYDSTFGLPTNLNTNKARVSKFSLISDNRLTESWQSKLQLAQGMDDYQDFTDGLPTPFGSMYKTINQQLSWQNMLQFDAGKQILLGAEHLNQRVSSDIQPAYIQGARKVDTLYAGYTGNYGGHQLQANLRQDQNSQYGNAGTGLLGYGYTFNEAWRATASYSTAFRAPSFNELYYPGFGNANLKPEHARNTEAGLHYTVSGQHVDATYFDNRTRDLIDTVLVDPVNYVYQPLNVNAARTDGVELSYTGQFGDTGVKAALTSQNPRNLTIGKVLDRRAKLHGSIGVLQQLGAWQVGGEWLHSGERADGAHTLASYNVVNLTAGYALDKKLRLSLRADNLTNQNDATAYGYNPLGRTLFAGLSYQQ